MHSVIYAIRMFFNAYKDDEKCLKKQWPGKCLDKNAKNIKMLNNIIIDFKWVKVVRTDFKIHKVIE